MDGLLLTESELKSFSLALKKSTNILKLGICENPAIPDKFDSDLGYLSVKDIVAQMERLADYLEIRAGR